MMGHTHRLSGDGAGLAVAPTIGLGWAGTPLFATTTAGYALLPDLDHPGTYAAHFAGPITRLMSRALRALSARVYQATKGPRDEYVSGTHRHLSHTLLFALAMGTLAAVGSWLSPLWGTVPVILVGTLLSVRALRDWMWLGLVPALLPVLVPASGTLSPGTSPHQVPVVPTAVPVESPPLVP